jgi:tetratricopeptide (TPR) repeat protein
MLVTLPFILLLLDFWPLRRFEMGPTAKSAKSFSRILVEKLPFFALAAISSVVTFLAQKQGGAALSLEQVSLAQRLANMLMAYFEYLLKLFWPANLALPYLPPQHWDVSEIILAVLALLSITLLVLGPGRNFQYLTVGWLWFIGMLVPVSGLVQVGSQFMADRYTYLPIIGCFIVISWGGWELVRKWNVPIAISLSAAILLLAGAGVVARHQVKYWRNSETFFRHSIQVTKDNYVAHNNLGAALAEQGRLDEAKGHFQESLQIRHEDYFANYNLGLLLATHGEFDEAAPFLNKAVEFNPSSADVYGKLGFAVAAKGRRDVAIAYYKEWVKHQPDEPMALNNLAWTLATASEASLRDGNEAVRLAQKACELTQNQQPPILGTLAAAYAEAGRFSDAVNTAERAIALAKSAGMGELAERNRQLLTLYGAGRAYHEPLVQRPANLPQQKP